MDATARHRRRSFRENPRVWRLLVAVLSRPQAVAQHPEADPPRSGTTRGCDAQGGVPRTPQQLMPASPSTACVSRNASRPCCPAWLLAMFRTVKPTARNARAYSGAPRSWTLAQSPRIRPRSDRGVSRLPKTTSASASAQPTPARASSRPSAEYRERNPNPTQLGESPNCRSPTAAKRKLNWLI